MIRFTRAAYSDRQINSQGKISSTVIFFNDSALDFNVVVIVAMWSDTNE
jgi:hypothetical protein